MHIIGPGLKLGFREKHDDCVFVMLCSFYMVLFPFFIMLFWGGLGRSGAVWGWLGLLGAVWVCLGLSGAAWGGLGVTGAV